MNHSQSFVQADTCFPLSAPWLQVVTVANRNTQMNYRHNTILCAYVALFLILIMIQKDQFNNLICFIFQ